MTDFQGELVVVNQDFSYNERRLQDDCVHEQIAKAECECPPYSIRRSFAEDIKGRTDSDGFLFDREYVE